MTEETIPSAAEVRATGFQSPDTLADAVETLRQQCHRLIDERDAARAELAAAQAAAAPPPRAQTREERQRLLDDLRKEETRLLGLWRHYKGGFYAVIAVAAEESTAQPLVVYQDRDGRRFARPLAEWLGRVDGVTRFCPVAIFDLPGSAERGLEELRAACRYVSDLTGTALTAQQAETLGKRCRAALAMLPVG